MIHRDAFDGFDSGLEIHCGCQYKPEGYFEGEYVEEHQEDGSTYYITHYGSWLRRSVVLRSRDCEADSPGFLHPGQRDLPAAPGVVGLRPLRPGEAKPGG